MKQFLCAAALFTTLTCTAQLSFDTSATALQLARYLAGSGILVRNAVLRCDSNAHAKFNGGAGVGLGIQDGVVLSSGHVLDINIPADGNGNINSQPVSSFTSDTLFADPNLSAAANNDVFDACILEFDMDVDGDSLKFNYVFGSEEYPEYVCATVNDIFAFFLSGPRPGGGNYNNVNIAKIPGTNLPVSINSLNPGVPGTSAAGTCNGPGESLAYSSLYIDNSGNNDLAYDGITKKLRAIAPTIPCTTYHLKIAVGDVGDHVFDSGVFLEAGSISSTNLTLTAGIDNTYGFVNAVEGCNRSGFSIKLERPLTKDFTVHYVIAGTATFATDFTAVPDSITISAGDTTGSIVIQPLVDNLTEPNESVIIYLLSSCSGTPYDSSIIYIQDSVIAVAVSPDDTICRGESTVLVAQGANRFTWSPFIALSNDTLPQITASPLSTTKYYVRADVGLCYDIDSVTITVTDALFAIDAGPNDTICLNEAKNINLQITGNQQPYQILWTGIGLNDTTSAAVVAQPRVSTTYQVTVIGQNHCVLRDSIRLVINGEGPVVTITADKNQVCFGDSIHLQAQIFPFSCGLAPNDCSGLITQSQVGDSTITFGYSPFSSSYNGERIQLLFRANELLAAGVVAGTITDVSFDVVTNGSQGANYNGFTMKMGCTDVDELKNTFLTGLTEVTTPAPYNVLGTGIFPVTLNHQYNWDGHSNLVIEMCWDNGNTSTATNDRVNSTPTSYNSVLMDEKFSATGQGCNLNFPFADNYRPNVIFTYCAAPPKTYQTAWSPLDGIAQPDSIHTAVILTHNQTYLLNVSDSLCTGTGQIYLEESRFHVEAVTDTTICAGNSVQLQALLTGDAPVVPVSCGTTSITCSSDPVKLTVDSGSNSLFFNPFETFAEDSRSQLLYLQSELVAAGMQAGKISSVGFKAVVQSPPSINYHNVHVKIACTAATVLDETVGWLPAQLVATYDSVVIKNGWNDFQFQTPYNWNGSSNLVVEICWDNTDGQMVDGDVSLQGTFTPNAGTLVAQTSQASGCSLNANIGFASTGKPMARFNICRPPLAPAHYVWTPSNSLSADTIYDPLAQPPATQVYTVAATFSDGCTKKDSVTVTVAPAFSATVPFRDTTITLGDSAVLYVNTSSSGNWHYQWTPGTFLNSDTNAAVVCRPTDSLLYRILVSNGYCSSGDSIRVRIRTIERDTYDLVMPNAFTPNGDGKNDYFFPVFKNGKTASIKAFRIYNRWGEEVFSSTSQPWDGRINGAPQPDGIYTYFLSVERTTGVIENSAGQLTLLR
ncbi:MAG: choice-of-anchor L domain-containing protein [Chitinophagales bacterium]